MDIRLLAATAVMEVGTEGIRRAAVHGSHRFVGTQLILLAPKIALEAGDVFLRRQRLGR
ncbi:MAG: hypothetical protein ACRD15_03960 [Vicinamibacterales bacterium]